MKLTNSISNNQGQVFEYWMASCLAMTLLGLVCANLVMTLLGFVRAYFARTLFRLFRASLQRRNSMTTNALRHCDDEERGRSNPGKQVQSWMASCLAMTLLGLVCANLAMTLLGFVRAYFLFPYLLIPSFPIKRM